MAGHPSFEVIRVIQIIRVIQVTGRRTAQQHSVPDPRHFAGMIPPNASRGAKRRRAGCGPAVGLARHAAAGRHARVAGVPPAAATAPAHKSAFPPHGAAHRFGVFLAPALCAGTPVCFLDTQAQ